MLPPEGDDNDLQSSGNEFPAVAMGNKYAVPSIPSGAGSGMSSIPSAGGISSIPSGMSAMLPPHMVTPQLLQQQI